MAVGFAGGAVLLSALSYVAFDRNDAHVKAAFGAQLAVAVDNDEKAYAQCVGARAEAYSSREETNAIAIKSRSIPSNRSEDCAEVFATTEKQFKRAQQCSGAIVGHHRQSAIAS
jgi:hypothetical protein